MTTPYRTQKAAGLGTLHWHGLPVPNYCVLQSAADIPARLPYPTTFARPCPVTPRHGFVESRRVADLEELAQVVRETFAADPQGEIILMPFVDARRSAVATSNQITVGIGHDGATGGRAGAIVMPLAHIDIPATERVQHGYLESVFSHSNVVKFTQLRDGPSAPLPASSWIPQDVRVARILVPTSDALAWESTCQNAERGDFAHIPGGTMVCHAAVHCVLHGIPLSFEAVPPAIGDRVKANAAECPPMHYDDIAHGIGAGLLGALERPDAMKAAVFGVHQALALPQTRDGALAFGASVASLLRGASACVLGELRHTRTGARMLTDSGISPTNGRDHIYEKAWDGYAGIRGLLAPTARNYFNPKNWPSSSYGGPNWGNCTALTCTLDAAAQRMQDAPNADNFAALTSAAHNLVNAVHNGGGLFTKIVPNDVLNGAAEGRALTVTEGAYFAADLVAGMTGTHATLAPMVFDWSAPTKDKAKRAPGGKSFAIVPLGVKLQFRALTDKAGKAAGTRWQIIKGAAGKFTGSNLAERDFQIDAEMVLVNFPNMPCKLVKSGAGSGAEYRLVARTKWKALPTDVADWLRAQWQEQERADRGMQSQSDGDDDSDDDSDDDGYGAKCDDHDCPDCYPHND